MTTAEKRSPGSLTTPVVGVVKGGTGAGVRARGLWPERYELIDAWRGVAALLVCVHHVASATIGGWTTKVGGPAVMLFFVISGYCIAASADSCRRKGLGLGTFMLRRVRRIYPPYLLSLAFWIATRIVKKIQTGENDLAGRTLVEWVQNLTLTQWVTLLFHPSTYAAKNPTNFVTVYWSLGYEEQFYLVMGLFMVLAARLRWSVTAMTGVLMAVGLGVNIVWPEVACGLFIEYWALFAIGVLVFHRLCRMESTGMRRAVDALLVGILAWSAYMRWFAGIEWAADSPALSLLEKAEHRVVYGELMTASGFALVLIGMRPLSAWVGSKVWFRPLVGLGAITFSLYLIHQFNLTLMSKVAAMVLTMAGLTDFGAEGRWHIPYLVTQIAMHLGLATVFWFFCERPFLNKRV